MEDERRCEEENGYDGKKIKERERTTIDPKTRIKRG